MTAVDWLYQNSKPLQIIMWCAGGGLYTILVIFGTLIWKSRAYKYEFMHYLDEITRQEVSARDERIKTLEAALETETAQCESLRVKVRSMAALSEKSIEIAGSTYRASN